MKSDRLYLRIDPRLKERVQKYCDRNHTTASDLVIRFFVQLLKREEEERHPVDAKQI